MTFSLDAVLLLKENYSTVLKWLPAASSAVLSSIKKHEKSAFGLQCFKYLKKTYSKSNNVSSFLALPGTACTTFSYQEIVSNNLIATVEQECSN